LFAKTVTLAASRHAAGGSATGCRRTVIMLLSLFHPICHDSGGSRDRTIAVLIMGAARYDPFCRKQKPGHPGSGPLARPETGKARETLPAGLPAMRRTPR
jgi:hypothetical protein